MFWCAAYDLSAPFVDATHPSRSFGQERSPAANWRRSLKRLTSTGPWWCALRPLGLGSSHSRVGPNARSCSPHAASGSLKTVRYAPSPTTARILGRNRSTLRTRISPPSRSSCLVKSAAFAVARSTTFVIPRPHSSSLMSSRGLSSLGVNPAPFSAGQNRLPGPAKW